MVTRADYNDLGDSFQTTFEAIAEAHYKIIKLTRGQVLQLIKAERSLKMRTIFITIYAAGLRVSEAVRLATIDIDRNRQVILVRQGNPTDRIATSPTARLLPNLSSRHSAIRSVRSGLRRKLNVRLVVAANATGPMFARIVT